MSKFSKFSIIFICIFIITSFPNIIYGADTDHVIYEVDWLADNSAKVTLKWNNDSITTPIRITSWSVDDDLVTIRYQYGNQVITGFNKRTITDHGIEAPCVFILEEDLGANSIDNPIFPDLPSSFEGSRSIQHLYYLGIINGYPNGDFGPTGLVSRAEFSKMLFLSGNMSIDLDSPIIFIPLQVLKLLKELETINLILMAQSLLVKSLPLLIEVLHFMKI